MLFVAPELIRQAGARCANALPPTAPGLGVEVDETMFEKVNADPKRQYKWPHPTYQDGSVRDY